MLLTYKEVVDLEKVNSLIQSKVSTLDSAFSTSPIGRVAPWGWRDTSEDPGGGGGGASSLLLLSSRSAYSVTSAARRRRWSALIASALRRCRRSAAGQHTSQCLLWGRSLAEEALMTEFTLMATDSTACQPVRTCVWILWLREENKVSAWWKCG